MCTEKWKGLKNRLKTIIKRLKQTVSGATPTWPYYEKMVHLTRNEQTIHPQNIIEAGAVPYNGIRRPRVISN